MLGLYRDNIGIIMEDKMKTPLVSFGFPSLGSPYREYGLGRPSEKLSNQDDGARAEGCLG